MLQGTNVTKMS